MLKTKLASFYRGLPNLKWEWPLASLERGGNPEILAEILREAKQNKHQNCRPGLQESSFWLYLGCA